MRKVIWRACVEVYGPMLILHFLSIVLGHIYMGDLSVIIKTYHIQHPFQKQNTLHFVTLATLSKIITFQYSFRQALHTICLFLPPPKCVYYVFTGVVLILTFSRASSVGYPIAEIEPRQRYASLNTTIQADYFLILTHQLRQLEHPKPFNFAIFISSVLPVTPSEEIGINSTGYVVGYERSYISLTEQIDLSHLAGVDSR